MEIFTCSPRRYLKDRKELVTLKEATITQSPHAFVPKEHMTEKEREELYRTRLDESFKPYTVIDVLTRVFHRVFSDDLKTYI